MNLALGTDDELEIAIMHIVYTYCISLLLAAMELEMPIPVKRLFFRFYTQ